MTETRRNIPFDRFVAEAISLFKVLLFYLWQPIRRPVWFYETRIEVDHKDTQKFLVEISGIFGLLLALGLRFGSEAEGVPWTFFGYNMFDVIILGDFLIFVMAFFTLLIMASIFSSLELAGLILVGPKNVGVKNYLYYRVVTIISGIFLMMWATMFIAFARRSTERSSAYDALDSFCLLLCSIFRPNLYCSSEKDGKLVEAAFSIYRLDCVLRFSVEQASVLSH